MYIYIRASCVTHACFLHYADYTDCLLSTRVLSVGSTDSSIVCGGCGINTADSACAVLFRDCNSAFAEERASVGYTINSLPEYRVSLVGLSPNTTYCYRAALVLQTPSNCRQTYGQFTTAQKQLQEAIAYRKNETNSSCELATCMPTCSHTH